MLGTILMPRKNIHVHPLFDPLNLAPGIPGKPVLLVGRYFIYLHTKFRVRVSRRFVYGTIQAAMKRLLAFLFLI